MTSPDPRQPREVEIGPLHEAAGRRPDDGGFPVDHSRETPALIALQRRGYIQKFAVDGDTLRVAGTDRRYRPEDLRIRDHYRFEGTSDPDDMSVIYALEATDGTRGTLTDAYGSYADGATSAVVDRIRVVRLEGRRGWRRALLPATLGALTAAALVVLARRRTA